jgi:hypothetical protein
MNRILKRDDGIFDVLLTPVYITSPDIALMLGNWTDAKMRGYRIATFKTLQDAMNLAFSLPPIDWNRLVDAHQDTFKRLTRLVNESLRNGKFIVEVDSHMMDPIELKQTMFRRVKHYGERYLLFYNANDIVSINIINPWSVNLNEIANVLMTQPDLRIVKRMNTPTHIKLIGITDADTSYEIKLWPTIMAHWSRWIQQNGIDYKYYHANLRQLATQQNEIDGSMSVR